MTRHEWLQRFDRETEHALAAKFDDLVHLFIARGGPIDDPVALDALREMWETEVAVQLPPLRERAIRLLQAAPALPTLLGEELRTARPACQPPATD